MADNVNDSLKDLGKLIEDADKKVKQLDSDYKQGVNGAIVLLDSVKSKIAEVNNVGIKKIINAKDIEEEAKKIPTVFSHVIDDINKKAQRSGDEFSKKLTNADSVRSEAQRAFASIKEEYEKATKGMTPMGAVALANRGGVDTSILSSAARKRYEKQIQSEAARLQLGPSQITPELIRRQEVAQQNLNKALQQFAELQNQANAAQNAFAAKSMAVQALADKYANIDKQIENLRQKFAELYVKKDAGLIDDKKFTTQSNAIINKYNELVAKRDEFEKGTNIATQSYERESKRIEEENRLAAIRRENANSRQRDEVNAERMIAQARAERARKEAQADASMKKSVSQQVTNYKQLSALLKQYNSLKQVKGRTQEENAALEQTRAKIKEIIAAMRELDSKQSGSLGKARDITAYDRILENDKEITRERQKQNRLTNQQKSSLESLLPTLRRLASAFGVAFSVQGLVQFGKKLVETRGEFELQQVALRSILQNKQLADEIWDKTMQAALQSPFTAMQLTKYTKQLAAYRIETDKLFDTTKRLADVSAGLGVGMQRLILAYGQVKAANYLRASEIRQFTEAGVNVLGELSNYFSETRGQMYSTARVMDMVQKRMVKFEDVEAIFKRMTDEGGIFYNMQYIQSQTVKGQINKLHDAYDQMLNSIGKANEGTLKNMVAILNNIVKNWREWKTILDTIAWPAIGLALAKFSTGLFGIGASSVVATSGISALTKAGARLQIVLKRLMLNPWIAGASVAIAGVSWAINHAKAVKALNDRYDELNVRAIETKNNFDDYTKTVEDNNNKIRENQSILKTARRGSEEYEKAQNDLNEAQKSNSGIVAKLNTDYPEIAEKVSMANDNWVDLGDSIRIANEELENTILLNQMAKATFGNADLQSDISNAIESANKRLQIAAENRAKALKKIAQGTASDLDKAIANARDWAEQVAIIRQYEQGHWENQWMGAERGVQAVFVKRASGYKIPGEQGLQTTSQQLAKIRDDIKQQDMALREELHTVLMANKEFAKKITEEYEGNYEAFIEGNRKAVEKYMKYGEGEGWKMWNKFMVNYYSNAWGQKDVSQTVISSIQNLRPYGLDLLIDPNKKQTTGGMTGDGDDDGSKAKKNASRLISLIREMRAEYDKLSKSAYGYAKSEATVRESYKQSVKEILGKAGITDYDFTTNAGMIAALERVKTYAQKLGPEAAAEVEKYIGQLKTEMTINAQVKIREDFDKEMEKMFSDYELTLDLKKLSLPTGELEGIFDFDLTTIDALRKAVDTFYDEQKRLGADPTDLTKQVEGYYKKIDDMERKALLERLKTYTKYLTQGRDKAVQIHLDELKKMAEIDELYYKRHYSLEQYRGISSQIKRDTEKKLQENEWREFKESDFYTTMFEDLDHVATSSIDLMISELKKLQKNLNNLDPTHVKEIVKAIDNLEKRKRSRSPLKSFVEDFKTMLRWQKERDGYENALAPKLALKDILEERYKRDVLSVAKAEQDYNKLALDGLEGNEAEAKEYWDERLAALNLTKEQLKQVKNEIAEINEKNNEGYGAWVRTYQGVSRGAQYFSEMASAAGTIATEMMDMFDGVEDASKKLASDIADIAGNTAALGGDIAKAIASEGSDVGSMIDGLVRTWNIIKGIFSASEADINRTVERETEKLEILEHSLDRVKRARDRAWDTAKIIESEKETEKAINDMIASYRALIAAEQARKNPDENNIRQWMNEIEQLYEQLEEEREDFIGKFGGIGESGYLSAAEGFVEAWKSAFLETGDGLQGLQDHFDEFLQDWFVKQATMRIASRMLQPMFDSIDKAVDENSDGGVAVTMRELDALREWADVNFPLISDNLEDLAGMFGVGGEGSLSGLAAGIQGITEEQANILEAYWNSVRMYTASIDMNVSRIAEMLGAGSPNTNPMLTELETIASHTRYIPQIYTLLTGTRRNLGNGQGFITYNQ